MYVREVTFICRCGEDTLDFTYINPWKSLMGRLMSFCFVSTDTYINDEHLTSILHDL